MLALGIGANVAIFSLVNAVLLKPLPFRDPERLMLVHLLGPDRESPGTLRQMIWSYPKYQVFRENQQAFASTAAFTAWTWNLTGAGTPERSSARSSKPTISHARRHPAARTHLFRRRNTSARFRAAGDPRRWFLAPAVRATRGRDRTYDGLNGIPHTIVGVMPAGFRGLTGQAEIWVPITTLPADALGGEMEPLVHGRRAG